MGGSCVPALQHTFRGGVALVAFLHHPYPLLSHGGCARGRPVLIPFLKCTDNDFSFFLRAPGPTVNPSRTTYPPFFGVSQQLFPHFMSSSSPKIFFPFFECAVKIQFPFSSAPTTCFHFWECDINFNFLFLFSSAQSRTTFFPLYFQCTDHFPESLFFSEIADLNSSPSTAPTLPLGVTKKIIMISGMQT